MLDSVFPIFKNRNFRLFFWGQLISFTGTWMQLVAQGWLMFELTHSNFAVGMVALFAVLPVALLAPIGGVLADKLNCRSLMLAAQWLGVLQAFTFGLLVVTHHISPFVIDCLALLWGFISAAEGTSRQTLVMEIVGKELLPSAIAINEFIVNLAFAVGPMVGGILIQKINVGATCFANSASFLAMIIALSRMKGIKHREPSRTNPRLMLSEGARYTFSHPQICPLIFLVGITAAFGFPPRNIIPAIAKGVFHVNAETFGWLSACPGIGALIGLIIISKFSQKISPGWFIFVGNAITAISLSLFFPQKSIATVMILFLFSGIGFVTSISSLPALLRGIAKPEMLGRVIGFDITMFFAGMALGNYGIGYVAEHIGSVQAVSLNGICLLILTLFFAKVLKVKPS